MWLWDCTKIPPQARRSHEPPAEQSNCSRVRKRLVLGLTLRDIQISNTKLCGNRKHVQKSSLSETNATSATNTATATRPTIVESDSSKEYNWRYEKPKRTKGNELGVESLLAVEIRECGAVRPQNPKKEEDLEEMDCP